MSNESLSKNAQAIQNIFSQRELPFKVVELSTSTRTANAAAATIGCEVGQIIKSLIFKCSESNKPILILVSGANRVNEKAIEQIVGEKIQKADADFTKAVTGFTIGGIPPVGHTQKIDTLIDEDLLKFQELWAAAGTPYAVFKLSSDALVTLTNGRIISIK